MKRTITMVCKGILLYTTIILSIIFLMGADDLYDKGWLFPVGIVDVVLILIGRKYITHEEADILLLQKLTKENDTEI